MRISDWSSDVCSSDLGVERCTDLVTHVGEEIALGLCRRFDIALRAFQQHGLLAPARGAARDQIEKKAGHQTGETDEPRHQPLSDRCESGLASEARRP